MRSGFQKHADIGLKQISDSLTLLKSEFALKGADEFGLIYKLCFYFVRVFAKNIAYENNAGSIAVYDYGARIFKNAVDSITR